MVQNRTVKKRLIHLLVFSANGYSGRTQIGQFLKAWRITSGNIINLTGLCPQHPDNRTSGLGQNDRRESRMIASHGIESKDRLGRHRFLGRRRTLQKSSSASATMMPAGPR